MELATTTDVRPVCPTHRTLMLQRRVLVGIPTTSDRCELDLYFCEAVCSKAYGAGQGYFDWVPGLMISEMIGLTEVPRVQCRSCGGLMYISREISPQNKAEAWCCTNEGCCYTQKNEVLN